MLVQPIPSIMGDIPAQHNIGTEKGSTKSKIFEKKTKN